MTLAITSIWISYPFVNLISHNALGIGFVFRTFCLDPIVLDNSCVHQIGEVQLESDVKLDI